ncbi:unnamed protein product [Ilex paraguariensis]|uniref:Probable glutathione S-transferase n=1 Tax=Ilex paraguariensis TaxID=185542 RepID=A0ABC8U8R3_9AQUA
MAEEVKLFGALESPFSCRVVIALKMKGVQYEYIEEDLPHKSPLLLKYNPVHKKIPVLLHNGKPICESLVILEYIDETWKGTPIFPQDPSDRATARFWAQFLEQKCLPTLWKACCWKGEGQEKAKEEAYELMKMLDNELEGKRFFGGDTIGLVDIVGNFIGFWYGIVQEITGVELWTKEKFPRLCEWIDEFVKCTIVKENLPPREKLLAYFRTRLRGAAASK